MKKSIIATAGAAAALTLTLAACGSAPADDATSAAGEATTGSGEATSDSGSGENSDFKACMVSDSGGFDDKSFNQAGFEGLKKAESELGIQTASAESASENDFVSNIEAMVAANCNLIITVGFLLGDATADAAAANPDVEFAIIDFSYEDPLDNVKGLIFETDQPSFLAGYAAAALTKTGTVATFGGVNIPTVTIFMDGYLAGVNYYNEAKGTDVKVLGWDGSSGSFTETFEEIPKGQELAKGLLGQGADIIMPVAGPVGAGAATEVKSQGNAWFIGVDSDWAQTNPDTADVTLTSVMKNMTPAVFDVVKAAVAGEFSNEPYVGTLENGGLGLAPFASGTETDELTAELKDLTDQIIAGTLKTS